MIEALISFKMVPIAFNTVIPVSLWLFEGPQELLFGMAKLCDIVFRTFYVFQVLKSYMVQLVGAVEYTDCISAEGYNSFNKCPGYDTKQSDGQASVNLELWGMLGTPSLPSHPGPL